VITTAENRKIPAQRIRFSVRTLLVVVLGVAFLLWGGREAYDRYHSIPLADAVSEFNSQARDSEVGRYEPLLTQSEVTSVIRAQLPLASATPEVNAIFRRIGAKERLPKGARFESIPESVDENGTHIVWWIRLFVPQGQHGGYALAIRDTNDPAVLRTELTSKLTNLDIINARERYQSGRHESN
jgi:hypothetical protein